MKWIERQWKGWVDKWWQEWWAPIVSLLLPLSMRPSRSWLPLITLSTTISCTLPLLLSMLTLSTTIPIPTVLYVHVTEYYIYIYIYYYWYWYHNYFPYIHYTTLVNSYILHNNHFIYVLWFMIFNDDKILAYDIMILTQKHHLSTEKISKLFLYKK